MKYKILSLISFILIISCTDDSTALVPEVDLLTVWAYVYADEQLDDIKLTSTIALDSELEEAPLVSGANVVVSTDSGSFTCIEDTSNPGNYYYPGTDFEVSTGDQVELTVTTEDETVYAISSVPPKPIDVSINTNTMTLPVFTDRESMREWRENAEDVEITWIAESGAWYYVVLENVDSNPQAIDTMFPERLQRRIFPPIQDNHYRINFPIFTHTGLHLLTVYRVNQEYVDLYEYREQDSRDLQEPLTNIEGGLGIFSAFNSDNVTLNVTY
ncbi:MAG: DUF4249 family protein [Candidatus Marinimicrobia bacterium]|nr:DUF4249 family protein [Candidatus Neomarinimicrobiota bacterium]